MRRAVLWKLEDRVAASVFATWCHPSYARSCPLLGAHLYRSGVYSSPSPYENRSRDDAKAGAANGAYGMILARFWPLGQRTQKTRGGLALVSPIFV